MSVSLRDLDRRLDALPTTHFDAEDLMRRGEARMRRRRLAAVAAVTALVFVVVGGALLVAPSTRQADQPADQNRGHDQLQTRRLTYAVGSTIYWGDSAIDVGQTVQAVGATDDGVVFVRGNNKACRSYSVACQTSWFTDGAEPVRMGTVSGSWVRGWAIAIASAGSTVVWESGTGESSGTGEYVVYDTSVRHEVGRLRPNGSSWAVLGTLLAVGDRSVFWVPNEKRQCVVFDGECVRYRDPIMRFEVTTGQQRAVTWESYRATRRGWSRTLMSPPHGEEISDTSGTHVVRPPHADPELTDKYGFRLEGTRLLGDDRGVEVSVRLAQSGQPLQLRVPASYPSGSYFGIFQWLDDDHVAMWSEDGSLLVCPVPDGRCRTVVEHGGVISFAGHG